MLIVKVFKPQQSTICFNANIKYQLQKSILNLKLEICNLKFLQSRWFYPFKDM